MSSIKGDRGISGRAENLNTIGISKINFTILPVNFSKFFRELKRISFFHTWLMFAGRGEGGGGGSVYFYIAKPKKKWDVTGRNFTDLVISKPSTGCVSSHRITQTNRKTMGHHDSQPTDGSFVRNHGDHWWHNGGQSCVSIERRDPVPRTRGHLHQVLGVSYSLLPPPPPNTSLEPLDSCFLSLNCQKQWDYCAGPGIKGSKRSRDGVRENE